MRAPQLRLRRRLISPRLKFQKVTDATREGEARLEPDNNAVLAHELDDEDDVSNLVDHQDANFSPGGVLRFHPQDSPTHC